jgi:hypothetical protein
VLVFVAVSVPVSDLGVGGGLLPLPRTRQGKKDLQSYGTTLPSFSVLTQLLMERSTRDEHNWQNDRRDEGDA